VVVHDRVVERTRILSRWPLKGEGQHDRSLFLGGGIRQSDGKRRRTADESETWSCALDVREVQDASPSIMETLVPFDLFSDHILFVGRHHEQRAGRIGNLARRRVEAGEKRLTKCGDVVTWHVETAYKDYSDDDDRHDPEASDYH
jgi:hypothetical protein